MVVTDGDPALARRWCDELLDRPGSERAKFVYEIEPLAASIARARALADAKPVGSGPVVLLDHYDNCASGGTMDTMTVLGAILDAGLDDVAAFAIFDPAAVQQMIAAGVGAEVTLSLGGKLDMPAIGLRGQPREVTRARSSLISTAASATAARWRAASSTTWGRARCSTPAGCEIVVISHHVEPHDLDRFTAVGIDPMKKRFVMLKSRIHWRAGLRPLAQAVVECAGTGVCTSDYAQLKFKNVRRPIYPLDAL